MRHRRRHAATAASIPPGVSEASESNTASRRRNDIRDVYEGRAKAQRLLADLEQNRGDAASALTHSFAKALNLEHVDIEGVFTQYREWEVKDDRLGQQIDAFTDLRAMLVNRWTFFKAHHPDDVLAVLTNMLEQLRRLYVQRDTEVRSLRRRIEELAAEVRALTPFSRPQVSASADTASSYAEE